MTPGAAALATLFLIRDKMPPSWRSFFVDGQQNWKTVVVPLLLAGLCYVIGVIFEVVDYAPLMRSATLAIDATAFSQAWAEFGGNRNQLDGWPAEHLRRLRFHLWETLVFKGGCDVGTGTIFAHCHRFQAEYKMFLHFIYPAVLFALFSVWAKRPLWWACVDLVVIVPILFGLAHLRNRRRWLQTVSFCKQLHLIDSSVEEFAPQEKSLHRATPRRS